MKHLVQFVTLLLPASRVKNWLLSRAGWSVASTASVQPCIGWRIVELKVGHGAYVGLFNIFRDLELVQLGEDSVVGQFNWVSAASRVKDGTSPVKARTIVLESGASVTSRHYLDCSGGIELGRLSTIAGIRSVFLSHSPDFAIGKMQSAPIIIGDSCFLSTGCTVLKGVRISNRVVVAASSTVVSDLTEAESLYGGVPAKRIGPFNGSGYFDRQGARIDPTSQG